MKSALLAAMVLGAVLTSACTGGWKPTPLTTATTPTTASHAEGSPSASETPTVATTMPAPRIECVPRSDDHGYPVGIGRAPGFCLTWAVADGASGYSVRLAREGKPPADYQVASGRRLLVLPPGDAPEYRDAPEIRCFKEAAFRVSVSAQTPAGERPLGGVDVTNGCMVRRFTPSGCVAPDGPTDVSWMRLRLDDPDSFEPMGCIAWIDSVSGEKGFRVELAYSGRDNLAYELPPDAHELIIPPADRPPADLGEAFRVHRKDFSITIIALFDGREEAIASTAVIVG